LRFSTLWSVTLSIVRFGELIVIIALGLQQKFKISLSRLAVILNNSGKRDLVMLGPRLFAP
jgi:hypothetical protein